MYKPTISISIIVRNEEVMLERCLESVLSADEIVIVDTGSIDKTIEIANRYTVNIHYKYPWIDDFSEARNFAKNHCTSDWIVSIDADERMEEDGIEKLRNFLATFSGDVLKINMKSSNQSFYTVRVFRNDPKIFWIGKIHETLNIATEEKCEVSILFGSSPAHLLDPDRNFRILKKSIGENPIDSRTLYYLAREYGYKAEWHKAIAYFRQYLVISQFLSEKADAFFMLALCHWNISEGELARNNCLQALSINANFKAASLLMGHMSFEKNSVQWYKMAETATNEGVLFIRDNFLII